VRGEREDGQAGFKDRGERFHAIGDAGDDQVCFGGEDLFGVGGPTVVEDVEVLCGELGQGFDAVLCAGAEVVETVEGGDG